MESFYGYSIFYVHIFWVGDGISDHYYWKRLEDMATPRQAYKIYANHLGSDLAGETIAAMVVASIVFRHSNPAYSNEILNHVRQPFTFANIEANMIATSLLHNNTMVLGVDTVMNFCGQRHGFMRPPRTYLS